VLGVDSSSPAFSPSRDRSPGIIGLSGRVVSYLLLSFGGRGHKILDPRLTFGYLVSEVSQICELVVRKNGGAVKLKRSPVVRKEIRGGVGVLKLQRVRVIYPATTFLSLATTW